MACPGDGPDSAFWARMKERLNDRALVMLRPAHVLKGVGDDSWRSFAAAEAALLNGRSHPTVPVMDYILGETAKAWLEQQYGRLSEGDDGRALFCPAGSGGGAAHGRHPAGRRIQCEPMGTFQPPCCRCCVPRRIP